MKFLLIVFSLPLISCSGLTPLYSTNNDIEQNLQNVKIEPVSGRFGVYLKNELTETFRVNKSYSEEPAYTLQAEISIGDVNFESYNADGTASRAGISVEIGYRLYDDKDCEIINYKSKTRASYNSKSDGYDFGNIASKDSAIESNIEYNVKQFYPRVYRAMRFKKEELPYIPPYLFIDSFKGC